MPVWRLSSFYFFYFALLGAMMPFWNLYLAEQGYSPREIGALGAIMMCTKLFSPYLLGWLADITLQPMRVIRWNNFVAFLLFLPIFLLPSDDSGATENRFLYLALIMTGFTFFWNGIIAQYESVTLLSLGDRFKQYGRIRAWGSIGFIAAVSVLGWVFENTQLDSLLFVVAVLLLCIWLSSLGTGELAMQPNTEHRHGISQLLYSKPVLAFFFGCFLVKFAHGPYYTFYSIYLDAYGYSKISIGMLWGGGVLAELVLFFYMGTLLQRFSLRTLMVFSLGAGILRWAIIGFFPQSFTLIVVAQIAHAFTFASYHATAVEWVRRKFGVHHQGQGQALYSAISFGAGGAAGSIVSGLLWTDLPSSQWQLTWLVASAASFVGLVIFWRYTDTGYTGANDELTHDK